MRRLYTVRFSLYHELESYRGLATGPPTRDSSGEMILKNLFLPQIEGSFLDRVFGCPSRYGGTAVSAVKCAPALPSELQGPALAQNAIGLLSHPPPAGALVIPANAGIQWFIHSAFP